MKLGKGKGSKCTLVSGERERERDNVSSAATEHIILFSKVG
jgi:hypothetical protein